MHLSKLEILGFKSFANRTNLKFTRGITGIVGPNGCGKTNIVDAIRWCLGEQKTTTLRSDKMENVIFNGTRAKKPMGMSEVSLTIVNDSGILPTEYSEVVITRRIFRSGESEYLLNKNICRLKDITNLFMDTGMGTNAYSVIELKMVETILSNKADERRRMFEEAAGVNKYKLRRRLALKKLDDVKADLTRVNDIVSEVEKNVRSLERQAKKADQYNQIQSVLREKELDLAEREFASFHGKKSTMTDEKGSLNSRKEEIDTDIRKIENELIVFRTKINEVESELKLKRGELSENNEIIHEIQRNISVAEERIKSLNRNKERYISELEELKEEKNSTDRNIEENNNLISELERSIEEKNTEISNNAELIEQNNLTLEEKRSELKTYNETALNKYKDLSSKENKITSLNNSLESINTSIEKHNDKIQQITNRIAKTVGFLEELNNEKSTIDSKLKESESNYAGKQKEKEELEKELNKLKEKELDVRSVINGLKEKINFLQTVITNLDGIPKGSKVLIESEGWTEREKTLFADVGNADEKYRFALDAALKSVLNNLLIENLDDLQKAIDYLKNNELGKASFYLLEQPTNGKGIINGKFDRFLFGRKVKKIEREKTFIGWAYNYVQTKDKWKPYFRKVLLRTGIATDLKSAINLSEKYPSFNFVSVEGDLVQSGGIIEAGSAPTMDETLFGRKQLLEKLKGEYPAHEKELENLRREISITEEKISQINLKELSDRGKILVNDINNLEKQITQFEFEKKKASEEIENAQKEIQELAKDANVVDSEIETIKEEIELQSREKRNAEEELARFEAELQNFEREFNQSVGEQNAKKLELERLKGQLQNTKNAITRSQQNKESILGTIQKREEDIRLTEEETHTISSDIEDSESKYDELNIIRERLKREEEEIDNKLKEIKNEASGYEKKLTEHRNEREQISDKIHDIDIKMNEINLRLENLQEDIKEDYSVDLELKEFDDLDEFNFEETSAEVHRLKEKLKNLGPINLLAYSEYEEEKERLDFLHKQRDDLIDSEKDLVNTIHEINETAQQLFLDTFEQIRNSFKNIFQTLFNPGDEADLYLEEDADPLESKIEILAKPKGKRPTSIELLSGGEKTLTATALLFAIYLVKPSPFCILDEVDAPLDDANIDRFTKLIKEFSEKTQFIIVTHNKRTMEAAENMYGVTMQEEGISKLVSVQFNEDLNLN